VCLMDEEIPGIMFHPFDPEKNIELDVTKAVPLLNKVMEKGQNLLKDQELKEIASYVQIRLQELPEEHKRFNNPHIYKVGISEALQHLRNDLRKKYKK